MIRVYIGIALAVLLGLGGWWLHHTAYDAGYAAHVAEVNAAVVKAAAAHQAQVVAADKAQVEVTNAGAAQTAQTKDRIVETVRTITKVVHDTPAPAECVAAPDGVRALTDAVARANAAARGVR